MTILVGVLAKDGAVIGSDSATTFCGPDGVRTIEQISRKIEIVNERVIVAGTGQVGLNQRFVAVVKKNSTQSGFNRNLSALEVGKLLSSEGIKDFASTSAPMGQFGALVAFPIGEKPSLCEFALRDFQPELKTDKIWYVSAGSGQGMADPFLGFIRKVFWKSGPPSCSEAVFAVLWTLLHAIELNTGGINGPPDIAVLQYDKRNELKAHLLETEEMEEHKANVKGAEEHLSAYAEKMRQSQQAEDIPRPAANAG